MIHIIQGDLLESDCTVIGHQANCFSTMGAGIAKQIRSRYPEAYKADCDFPYAFDERLGKCSRTYVDNKRRVVVNLYGQFHYGRDRTNTNYGALQSALTEMFKGCMILEEKGFPVKVGLPYGIGCGLAGGDWNLVSEILKTVSDTFGYDIYLYKL